MHGQLPQQQLVHDREDGRIGADAEGQRQDGDDGKQGAAAQAAEREAEVVGERRHPLHRRRLRSQGWQAPAAGVRRSLASPY